LTWYIENGSDELTLAIWVTYTTMSQQLPADSIELHAYHSFIFEQDFMLKGSNCLVKQAQLPGTNLEGNFDIAARLELVWADRC